MDLSPILALNRFEIATALTDTPSCSHKGRGSVTLGNWKVVTLPDEVGGRSDLRQPIRSANSTMIPSGP